jgi:WD40 repeat protein
VRTDLDAPTRSMSRRAAPEAGRGRCIGSYRLLQKLGEGGMGEVWLAEQTSPVRRRVAMKLIRRGMDSAQVVARFEAERQALALMNHPNVAKVFDAGTTHAGTPYFVMEHVAGVSITDHCDRHRLTIRERLELLMEVCEGLQHAHQRGIIHRDIKPSNVLVTVSGDRRIPKIIDFGVAKATSQRLSERTVFTELGQLIGTPEYMSPEQADLTSEDVDIRTDIYSVGVILYELLTGTLPFDSRELRGSGFDELRRTIREVEPPRPSRRISLVEEGAHPSARDRSTDLRSLRRAVQGDLDWITMKALAKDRTRRYGSAVDLASDIRRHLGHQPVKARPPGMTYRAGLFIRRHRLGVAVTALALLVLVGVAAREVVQARRVARERNEAVWLAYASSVQAAADALTDGRVRAARAHLASCPRERRGWEWSMLQGTLPSSPHRLDVGWNSIARLRAPADAGRLMLLFQRTRSTRVGVIETRRSGADGGLREWTVLDEPHEAGTILYLDAHAMDASGTVVARCNRVSGRLQVLRAAEDAADRLLWSRPQACRDLAFSGPGTFLAAGGSGSTTPVFDVSSGEIVTEVPAGSLAGASDAPILGVLEDRVLALHDLENGKTTRVPLPVPGAETFVLSPLARYALLGYTDGLLVSVDVAEGEVRRLRTGTQGTITALEFHRSPRVVAFATNEGAIGVIEKEDRARLVARHDARIDALAIGPDPTLFAADASGTILEIPLSSDEGSLFRRSLEGLRWTSWPRRVRLAQDGRIAAVTTYGDEGVMLLDGRSLRFLETLYPRGSGLIFPSQLFWSSDGRRLMSHPLWSTPDRRWGLRIWEVDASGRSKTVLDREQEPEKVRMVLGVSGDTDSWLLRTEDLGVLLERLMSGAIHPGWKVAPEPLGDLPTAALWDAPRDRWILGLGDSGLVALADTDGGIVARHPEEAGVPLAMHPSGDYFLAGRPRTGIELVDASSLRGLAAAPREGRQSPVDARFTPDGSRFVLGFRDGTIEVWSTARMERILALTWPTSAALWSLDVASGGRLIAAFEDELVALGPWRDPRMP